VEDARVTDARAVVLGRIREALGPAPAVPEVPRDYRAAADGGVELFCERVAEYRATVHRTTAAELEATVRRLCGSRVAVPPRPPCAVPGAVQDGPDVPYRALEEVDAVLTGCRVAIADTGTIVLDGSPACGRRALTLIPDHHVCVVHAGQIVGSVPEAIAELAGERRPITLVSGPSATSDIELERVEGVHGPRVLDVVVVLAPG
jgi:L-lactate dehydrogenase complex protein LldG